MNNAIFFLCIGIALGITLNRLWPTENSKSKIETVYFDASSNETVYYNRFDDPWKLYSSETGYATMPISGYYEIKNFDGVTFNKNVDAGDKFLNPIYVKRLGPRR